MLASLASAQVRSDAADREASVPNVMIPVAGDVPGAFGTQFQTDVTIANRTQSAVQAGVFWLPQNRSGSVTIPLRILTLPPNSTQFFPRFVTDTLNETGLGAFILRALNDDGSPNVNARIDVFARIWTPAHTGGGTYSQGVYSATTHGPGTDDLQPISAWVYGLHQSSGFRTNYGIVNMTNVERTFDIDVIGQTGARLQRTVTLPAASMIHEPLPQGQNFGQLTIQMVVQYSPFNLSPAWTGYGSTIDNITGDAWYSKAQASYPNTSQPR